MDSSKLKSLHDLPVDDSHLEERPLHSELIQEGSYLRMYRDQVQLPNGNHAIREYLVHPGATAIIPVLPDGRILLERQYRYPLNHSFIEIPAGKLDVGEDPLDCAKRELKEETGFEASEWVFLGKIHPVISHSTEFIDIFMARGLTAGPSELDEGEFLDVFSASLPEIEKWIKEGRITDVKTIISIYWLKDHLRSHS